MTPLHRSLSGDVLAFDLVAEMEFVRAELAEGHARIARTLVKEGALRLTLIGLSPGAAMHEHESAGPVTIHVLDGSLDLDAEGETHAHQAGSIVALDRRVRHAVRSSYGALFLLTLAAPTTSAEPS